jgi:hypothetical protein
MEPKYRSAWACRWEAREDPLASVAVPGNAHCTSPLAAPTWSGGQLRKGPRWHHPANMTANLTGSSNHQVRLEIALFDGYSQFDVMSGAELGVHAARRAALRRRIRDL